MVWRVFDPKIPFFGEAAVRDRLLTRARLHRDFVALYRGVYLDCEVEPDRAMRSRAAYLVCRGRGVLAGYSAAELLGAGCSPLLGRPEVIVFAGSRPPGLGRRQR